MWEMIFETLKLGACIKNAHIFVAINKQNSTLLTSGIFSLCLVLISLRLKDKAVLGSSFQSPQQRRIRFNPRVLGAFPRSPTFDFPPFPDRPFPSDSSDVYTFKNGPGGSVRGRVKGMVVIEWVSGMRVRKDAGEIGRKRKRRWQREQSKGRRSKKRSTRKGGGNGHHRSGAKQPSRRVSL